MHLKKNCKLPSGESVQNIIEKIKIDNHEIKELITVKVLISLIAVVIGIYFVRRAGGKKVI